TGTPDVTADMDYVFTLTVADPNRAEASATANVEVRFVNQLPVADAGEGGYVMEGDTVLLEGSGSDPDGGAITYNWVSTSHPDLIISNADTDSPTFDAPDVPADTDFDFELTVTDNDGGETTSTVTV